MSITKRVEFILCHETIFKLYILKCYDLLRCCCQWEELCLFRGHNL